MIVFKVNPSRLYILKEENTRKKDDVSKHDVNEREPGLEIMEKLGFFFPPKCKQLYVLL